MSQPWSHSKWRPLWIAAVSIIALPFAMHVFGLSVNTASMVVILAIATMALNLCVGYTGLVSFGHSTWFGIGAYAAGLIQLHWFHDQIWLPILESLQSSLPVVCNLNLITMHAEARFEHARDLGFIVHNKNSGLVRHSQ